MKLPSTYHPLIICLSLIGIAFTIILPTWFNFFPWYGSISIILLLIGMIIIITGIFYHSEEPCSSNLSIESSQYSFFWGYCIFIIGIISLIALIMPNINIIYYIFSFILLLGIGFAINWILHK